MSDFDEPSTEPTVGNEAGSAAPAPISAPVPAAEAAGVEAPGTPAAVPAAPAYEAPAMPAQTVPAQTVPAQTVPAQTVPAQTVPAAANPQQPTNDAPTTAYPPASTPGSSVPASGAPASGTPAAPTYAPTAAYPAAPGYAPGYATPVSSPAGYPAPISAPTGYGAPAVPAKRGKAGIIIMSILAVIFLLGAVAMGGLFAAAASDLDHQKTANAAQQSQIADLTKQVSDTKDQLSALQTSTSGQIDDLKKANSVSKTCINDIDAFINLPNSASNSTLDKSWNKMVKACIVAKAAIG